MEKIKKYIYDRREVVMTGRRAFKKITTEEGKEKVDTLWEVGPSDNDVPKWNSWVRMRDLYEIVEGEDEIE